MQAFRCELENILKIKGIPAEFQKETSNHLAEVMGLE
jgi:hypothetical protein